MKKNLTLRYTCQQSAYWAAAAGVVTFATAFLLEKGFAASTIGILLIAVYLWFYVKDLLGRIGLALVIGGGIGNMIDRVAYGFVVDFIDFCAFDFWKWVFNIADSAVCVGAGLFMLYLVLDTVKEYKKQQAEKAAGVRNDAENS